MRKVVIKLLIFIVLVIGLGLIARYSVLNFIYKNQPTSIYETKKIPQCVFVGNSRINNALNDSVFANEIKDFEIHNYAIPGMSFNYSLKMIEKLSTQTSNSVFYVELGQMHTSIPYRAFPYFSIGDQVEATQYFYQNYNLGNMRSIKKWLFESTNLVYNTITSQKYFNILSGKVKLNNNLKYSPRCDKYSGDFIMISKNNFAYQQVVLENKQYKYLITSVIVELSKQNNRIYFLLPVTFKDANEKQIVSSIYRQIPIENKLIYSDNFLNQISSNKNLADNNHLNVFGSNIFTQEMIYQFKKAKH
ncbi:MAG: hypothetical protein RLZZ175_2054 [Bacteroidota bacterium]|jgi:hypothetical protein